MKWLEIIKVGNDDLREVYETVWSKSILTAEQDGIRQYKNAVAKVRATLPPGNPKQAHTELLPLYQEAARNKPAYDKTMCMLQKLFRDKTGVELGMSRCPTLKKVSRIVEKSLLKSRTEGDVSGVKDIIRLVLGLARDQCFTAMHEAMGEARQDECCLQCMYVEYHPMPWCIARRRSMGTVTTMSHVATVLDILLEMQSKGLITMKRVKERFLSRPSGGGSWSLPVPSDIRLGHLL